jgi:hypothetical protein
MFSGPSDPMPHIAQDQTTPVTSPDRSMKSFSLLFGTLGAVVVIAGLLLVFGVRFTSDVMSYDAAKETVVKGTVTGFAEFACPASDGELGRHLTLKTADQEYEVHLAPARVMRSIGWEFKQGETIEVRGAPVRFRGKDGLLARQITVGDSIYTFRDPTGQMLVKQ